MDNYNKTVIESALLPGQQAIDNGDLDTAVQEFRKVSRQYPAEAAGHFLLGSVLLQQNKAAEAVPVLSKAVEIEPDNVVMQKLLSVALIITEQYPSAIEMLHALFEFDPLDMDVLFSLANVYRIQKNHSEALKYVSEMIKLKPDDHEAIELFHLIEKEIKLKQQSNQRKKNVGQKSSFNQPQLNFGMISVEITTYCNLRCEGCIRTVKKNEGRWHNKHMKSDDFRKIINMLPPATAFNPYGIGEPTLHPYLLEMIKIASLSEKFNTILLTTNALARDLDYFEKLFKAGLSIMQISVDSLDPILSNELRAGTDAEKLRHRIQALSDAYPGKIRINTVIGRKNIHDVPSLLENLNQMGKLEVFLQPFDDLGNSSGYLQLEERVWFMYHIQTIAKNYKNLKIHLEHFSPSLNICPFPWSGPYITIDGYVTPCCRLTDPNVYNFGNVFSKSFHEIWYSSDAEEFRKEFVKQSPSICEGCIMYFNRKNPFS